MNPEGVAAVEWLDEYLVGNERIDFEHQIFLGLIADFSKALNDGAESPRLFRIFEEIVLYAKFHFRSEENVLEDAGYPALAEHRQHHMELIETLGTRVLQAHVQSGALRELETFLHSWFIHHVLHEDRKFGAFLQQRAGGD